jgi:hypothetical protein
LKKDSTFSFCLTLWACNSGVLVLHDEPATVSLHDNKGSDVLLVFVFDAVWRGECAHPASDRHHGGFGTREAYDDVLDPVLDSLEERRMHLFQFLEHCRSSACPPAQRVDVIPIFRRKVCRVFPAMRIEGAIE